MADMALGFICKNEAHVVERMIRSCAPYITEVFALDTGSTDDTPDAIERVCADLGLPATVAQTEWTNFGEMRSVMMTEARKNSSAGWMLQMDADWELQVEDGADPFGSLDKGNAKAYQLTIHDSGQEWPLPKVTSLKHPWRYEGVIHEYLTDDGAGGSTGATLSGVRAFHHNDGGSRAGRHHRDVELLRGKDDPRSLFYYSQSLAAVGRLDEALDAYLVRAARTDGWVEESYWSLFRAAQCAKALGQLDRAVGLALRSWEMRPTRLEGLCTALEIFRETQQWQLGYMFGGTALQIAEGGMGLQDSLFVERWRWSYGAKFEYLAAASVVGNRVEARAGWEKMLTVDGLPDTYRSAVEYNLNWLSDQEKQAEERKKEEIAIGVSVAERMAGLLK